MEIATSDVNISLYNTLNNGCYMESSVSNLPFDNEIPARITNAGKVCRGIGEGATPVTVPCQYAVIGVCVNSTHRIAVMWQTRIEIFVYPPSEHTNFRFHPCLFRQAEFPYFHLVNHGT